MSGRIEERLARRGGAVELLRVPAALYGIGAGLRGALHDRGWLPCARVAAPVVCAGNITAGGTGKTPFVAWLVRELERRGRRPGILSRGYGGGGGANDEALLLAELAPGVPHVQQAERFAGALELVRRGADVIVMDDGFQNLSLRKDASLVVIDAGSGIGNGRVFPAGPLRAPLEAQLARAQALLVMGEGDAAQPALSAAPGLPVFHGRLVPDQAVLEALRPHPVLAFAGIGDPDKFFATLSDAGIDVRARQAFPDHHPYRRDEAAGLIARAGRDKLTLVTTEKDLVRLEGADDLRALAAVSRAVPVTLAVREADAFRRFILAACR